MLTETTTLTDAANEVLTEWKLIQGSTTLPRLGFAYDTERRRNKIPKTATYSRYYEIKTHSKNNWLLLLSKAPSIDKYSGMDCINILAAAYYQTADGLTVIKTMTGNNNTLSFYSEPFFKSYKETVNLELSQPLDIAKYFFVANGYSIMQTRTASGKSVFISVCSDGLSLGEIHGNNKYFIHQTFINKHYKENTIATELITGLQAEIEAALNENEFDELDYGLKADIITAIQQKR